MNKGAKVRKGVRWEEHMLRLLSGMFREGGAVMDVEGRQKRRGKGREWMVAIFFIMKELGTLRGWGGVVISVLFEEGEK